MYTSLKASRISYSKPYSMIFKQQVISHLSFCNLFNYFQKIFSHKQCINYQKEASFTNNNPIQYWPTTCTCISPGHALGLFSVNITIPQRKNGEFCLTVIEQISSKCMLFQRQILRFSKRRKTHVILQIVQHLVRISSVSINQSNTALHQPGYISISGLNWTPQCTFQLT